MNNLEMKIPYFRDVEDFLKYCKIHSRTPSALFLREHAEILYSMIGCSLTDFYDRPPSFVEIHESKMDTILESITGKNPDRLYV